MGTSFPILFRDQIIHLDIMCHMRGCKRKKFPIRINYFYRNSISKLTLLLTFANKFIEKKMLVWAFMQTCGLHSGAHYHINIQQ